MSTTSYATDYMLGIEHSTGSHLMAWDDNNFKSTNIVLGVTAYDWWHTQFSLGTLDNDFLASVNTGFRTPTRIFLGAGVGVAYFENEPKDYIAGNEQFILQAEVGTHLNELNIVGFFKHYSNGAGLGICDRHPNRGIDMIGIRVEYNF